MGITYAQFLELLKDLQRLRKEICQSCSFKGRKFLRVGDRVLEVQNTRVKDMQEKTKTDAVQELLSGCEVATIRVIAMKHTKP